MRAALVGILFSQDSVNIIVDNEQEDLRELDSDNDLSDDKDGEEEGDDDDEISEYILHPLLEELMDQCLDVWFSRHGYRSQDMAQGTKIEEPTIQKFSSMEYVVEFYEVGRLQMKKYPTIGVSPDGVAWVAIPKNEFEDQEMQFVCIEIKTREHKTQVG